MRKYIAWGLNVFFDIAAVVIIFIFLQPFAEWYISQTPAVGVDLFNSITYVSYHLSHFALPWNGFKDIWFGGYPLMRDFPQFAFYSMLPAAKLLGAGLGVQITALFSFFLFLFFSYLLFSRLSKNFGIAILLTGFVFLSANIYGALTWAGSIPSFISQLFFPLILFIGAKYLEKPELKYVAGCALLSALGILFHPLEIVTFVVPSVIILIVCGRLFHWKGILPLLAHLLVYVVGFFFGAFIFTYVIFISFITRGILLGVFQSSNSGVIEQLNPGAVEIANFYKSQVGLLLTQTHPALFFMLPLAFVLFVLGLVLAKRRKRFLYTIPFILIAGYTALHPIVNFLNIVNIFRHDPYRAFWPFPVALAAVSASLSGLFFRGLTERLHSNKWLAKLSAAHIIGVGFSVVFLGITFVITQSDTGKLIHTITEKIEYSSAFPEAVSLSFKKEETEKLSSQLFPTFMDPKDKNKRLYAADATFNIWWNSFFDLPLARGYIDPPIGVDRRGGLFWLDIAIANDSIVRDFKIPEEQAYQNALFLIDWNAIYFFEGGRLGSKGPSVPPSSYLLKNDIFDAVEEVTAYGAVLKWQTESGKPELHMDIPQVLKFYKVKNEYTSPVLAATNATPVLVITDFPGYEDILRLLGARNLNSKKIIPIFGDKYIDAFSEKQLKTFSAVILHQYSYKNRNRAYKLLESYTKNGGKVFIDTGSEIADADSNNLPEPLPIKSTKRQGMGKAWKLQSKHEIMKNVDLSEFAPPIYNDQEWKLTTPASEKKLRDGSEVYLTHDDSPILISRNVGSGKIIWSGINLPYHFNQYHKGVEAEVFEKLLGSLVSLEETKLIPATTEWVSPEKVRIKPSSTAKGILFKEEGYPGWSVQKGTDWGSALPFYVAGPTFPGFMYVPLKKDDAIGANITFSYNGEYLFWAVTFINIIAVILILELIIFNGKIVGVRAHRIYHKARKHIGSWWEKEEE